MTKPSLRCDRRTPGRRELARYAGPALWTLAFACHGTLLGLLLVHAHSRPLIAVATASLLFAAAAWAYSCRLRPHRCRRLGRERALMTARYRALRRRAGRLRDLIDAYPDTLALVTAEGRIEVINEAGARRLGKPARDLPGQRIADLLPPHIAAERRHRIARTAAGGLTQSGEEERHGRILEVTYSPVRNPPGPAGRVALLVSDVTARKRLERVDRLLGAIDRAILKGSGVDELIEITCQHLPSAFGLRLAWVGRRESDGSVTVVAAAGEAKGYLAEQRRIGVRWDASTLGEGPVGQAIRSGRTHVTRCDAPEFTPWACAAEATGLRTVAAVPLTVCGAAYGALVLFPKQSDTFAEPSAPAQLEEIAGRLALALERAADQQQLHLLSTALASAGNGIFITERDGRICWLNRAFSHLSGYSEQEALGKTPALLKSDRQDHAYYRRLWETIDSGTIWSGETVERHKAGHLYTVRQTITPIRDKRGGITHFVSIHEDITERKRSEERIRRMAHYDALTGLPNRTLFYEHLDRAMALTRRDSRGSLALLFVDLDHFKEVNDALGHAAGDDLLRQVAARLSETLRDADLAARHGGDEFTVILTAVDRPEDAGAVANKVIAALSRPFRLGNREVRIGTSIGIAFYPEDAESDDELVRHADQAMYVAKSEGRNRFRVYAADPTPPSASPVALRR